MCLLTNSLQLNVWKAAEEKAVTYRENVEGMGTQLNVGSHRSLWKDTSHSDDTCEPAAAQRSVAEK
jgi:hypothetical protein